MFNRYRFESEVYKSLDRIPLDVRMKLDRTGGQDLTQRLVGL